MSGVIYRDNPCGLKYIIVIFLIYIKCCRGFWFGFIYYNYSNDKIKKHIACIYLYHRTGKKCGECYEVSHCAFGFNALKY